MRIGIYGGTFDPVHNGHLLAAEAACDAAGLDKVVFVPAADPPHKRGDAASRTAFAHRYNMALLAIAGNERFEISAIESRLAFPSYSINTITGLEKELPKAAELYFITGMDAVCDLLTWREPAALLQKCRFLVANRHSGRSLQPMYDALGQLARERITLFESPRIDISATEIRTRAVCGKSIRYYTPYNVEKYIYDNKLYS